MGASESNYVREVPSDKHTATLYYFAGRGLADQIRWMLAATEVSFTQKIIGTRQKMVQMQESKQLPFGQAPLLQIDGQELVQSQAIVRYLARRAGIAGKSAEEMAKCDMIAESIRDVIALLCGAPFSRFRSTEEGKANKEMIIQKWAFLAARLEVILLSNATGGGKKINSSTNYFLVGNSITYVDVLAAHMTTWVVEECGSDCVGAFPLLIELQNTIISLPGVQNFIKSRNYFPIGDNEYVKMIGQVLNRDYNKK